VARGGKAGKSQTAENAEIAPEDAEWGSKKHVISSAALDENRIAPLSWFNTVIIRGFYVRT